MDFASVSGICDPVGKLLENAADEERRVRSYRYDRRFDPPFVCDEAEEIFLHEYWRQK